MSADYTDDFRANLVRRMVGPDGMSARRLAAETGVGQSTLSRWRLAASTLHVMSQSKGNEPASKSTRQWTAAEKLAVVAAAASVAPAELGEFLRKQGLRSTELDAWRAQIVAALGDRRAERRRSDADGRRIKQLEQELGHKDRRLRAAEALLDLQKKVREIWGDEGAFTPPKSAP